MKEVKIDCSKNCQSGIHSLNPLIKEASYMLIKTYQNNGKVLLCGNGGSCADADHIVGELMKSFEKQRPLNIDLKEKLIKISKVRGFLLSETLEQGLPTISLTAHSALITAISNDIGAEMIFAQQVIGIGQKDDVLIGLSTSGNSQNVIDAFIVAKAKGLKTIGMTGIHGGKLEEFCDLLIKVPETRTAYIQELHMTIYHKICLTVENEIFR